PPKPRTMGERTRQGLAPLRRGSLKTAHLQRRAVPTRTPFGLRVGRTPFLVPRICSVHPTSTWTLAPCKVRGKQPWNPLRPSGVDVAEPRPLRPRVAGHHVYAVRTLTAHAGQKVVLVLIG